MLYINVFFINLNEFCLFYYIFNYLIILQIVRCWEREGLGIKICFKG